MRWAWARLSCIIINAKLPKPCSIALNSSLQSSVGGGKRDVCRGLSFDAHLSLIAFLFENLQHRTSYPYLWLFQSEDVDNGGGNVILHHAFVEFASFLNVLSGACISCMVLSPWPFSMSPWLAVTMKMVGNMP